MDTQTLNSQVRADNFFESQKIALYNYLLTHTATLAMASKATGIKEKNLTRYKRKLENAGKLKPLKRDKCGVTGQLAAYLTTNPALFPFELQMSLFDTGGATDGK